MQELDGIFSSVQQGILVLDSDGRIVRSNKGFEKLAALAARGGQDAVGSRARSAAHRARAAGAGHRAAAVRGGGDRRQLGAAAPWSGWESARSSSSCSTTPRDLRRLETVKRDFVVNASHELRTPLTSIVGSLEMLEGALQGESARWVETIRRNAERMTAIVQDLLMLSGLEARGAEPSAEPRGPGPPDPGRHRHVRPPRGDAGDRARPDIPSDLPPITADAYLLEQVLVNLIDNALKYTEKGRCGCSASPDGRGRAIRIEVSRHGHRHPRGEPLPRSSRGSTSWTSHARGSSAGRGWAWPS